MPLNKKSKIFIAGHKGMVGSSILRYFKKKGYFVNLHYKALHLNPFYKNLGFKEKNFKNSLDFYDREISLPIYVGLSINELKSILLNLKIFFKN